MNEFEEYYNQLGFTEEQRNTPEETLKKIGLQAYARWKAETLLANNQANDESEVRRELLGNKIQLEALCRLFDAQGFERILSFHLQRESDEEE